MNTNTAPLNSFLETVSYAFDSTDTFPTEINLDYFINSIGIYNNTANDVRVWTNKYAPDNYVLVPAGAYKEVAVLTDWFKVDGTVAGSESISIDTTRVAAAFELSTPLYSTLYSPTGDNLLGADIKIDPINLGGFVWTPWVTSSGESSISAEESVLNVEYWLNGNYVSNTSSTNFYEDFFQMLMNEVTNMYPTGFTPGVNPPLDPTSNPEVVNRIREFLGGFNAPINDEYIAGWMSMVVYDDGLARTEVFLDAAGPNTAFQTPFEVLSWVVEPLSGSATIEHSLDGVTWSTPVTISTTTTFTEIAKYWRVTSGEVKLTFTGHTVKMISFAPILNIFYPIGFDDASGLPNDAFTSWQNYLSNFRSDLANRNFTGRVVYWRSVPFETTPHPLHNADQYIISMGTKPIDLVWQTVATRAWNWIPKSKLENDIVERVIDDNMAYLNTLPQEQWPKTLDDVLADLNLVVYGETTPQGKIDVLIRFMLEEYAGAYSTGGMTKFRNI